MSHKMGRARGSDAEYGAYGAGASGEFSQGDRMGGIHRCGDHGAERAGPADRIHSVGGAGAAQGEDAVESESSDPEGASSKSIVGIQGILRQQAV